MKKPLKIFIYTLIILIVLGFILYPKFKPKEAGPEVSRSPQQGGLLAVEAKVINPRQIENTINITGAILANESIALRSEISGKVEKIYFKEGQRISKGDLILSINDDEIVAQVERLKYTQQLNEKMEYRQRQLLEKEAISREEYDIALTTLKTTESDVKEREARLAKHKIYAPFDGIIGLRQVSEGSYISPSDLVANLYSINPIKIEFSVPGKYSREIHKGDTILFNVEISNDQFIGVVYAFEPRVDPRTRTLKIRAISQNDDGLLLPGQFAKISYVLAVIPDALMVPSVSVIPEMNGHKVFLYRNGMVNQENVEINLRTDKEVQVVSGLSPGDTVLTTGILQIRPGLPVELSQISN